MDEMDRGTFIAKVGTFFFLIGIGLMTLFVFSDISGMTNFGYFVFGATGLTAGFLMRRSAAKSAAPASNRFEGLRKIRQKQQESAKKREEAKKNKGKK
ncbi:MAG: hypothetical protein OHK0031_14530 [Anaerolineales bacterium]